MLHANQVHAHKYIHTENKKKGKEEKTQNTMSHLQPQGALYYQCQLGFNR